MLSYEGFLEFEFKHVTKHKSLACTSENSKQKIMRSLKMVRRRKTKINYVQKKWQSSL